MAAAIIIKTDVVIFRDPVKPRAHRNKWWAEGGLIHWEDQDAGPHDERYGSQTVVETLERLRGLNDMIGNNRSGKGWNMPSEMQAYRSYIDGMIELCKKAREQGMPDDASHSRQMVNEIKERRKSRMVVPGLSAAAW